MSEPDAVPLPREGEVFFDVRGEARSMRLSWYADSQVAVFSIWQGNRCTGTFRLPFADLARMVQTLQSGPPAPAHQSSSQREGYAADPMTHASMPGSAGGYSPAAAAYDQAPNAGIDYGHDRRYDDYGAAVPAGYGAAASQQADQGHPSGQDAGIGHYRDYDHGYGYGTGQDDSAGSGFAATSAYGSDQRYGEDPYHPSEPYGAADRYHSNEPYRSGDPYRASEPYPAADHNRATEQYSAPDHYGAPDHYSAPDQYGGTEQYGGEGYGHSEPYPPLSHGGDQPGHGLPDYAPPGYGDRPGHRADRAATRPSAAPGLGDWIPPAVPGPPNRGADSESVPDTAMMSFPSVPARNGPSAYR
jgi:hypothetical protein